MYNVASSSSSVSSTELTAVSLIANAKADGFEVKLLSKSRRRTAFGQILVLRDKKDIEQTQSRSAFTILLKAKHL